MYANKRMHMCGHYTSTYGPWYLSVSCAHTLTPLGRNPGYTIKRRLALPRVTLVKSLKDALERLLVARPATPSPLLSTPTPHQAAPDSARSRFVVGTTTPGAGEGRKAATRQAEGVSALDVPGPCGLAPSASSHRTVVGAQNVGFPGVGCCRGVAQRPGMRGLQGTLHTKWLNPRRHPLQGRARQPCETRDAGGRGGGARLRCLPGIFEDRVP